MKISSRGLGRKELVMDFRRYEIRREGDDVVVAGTITEPVKWDFSIRMTPGDIPGMIRVAVSPRTFGLGVRWALGLVHRGAIQQANGPAQQVSGPAQQANGPAQQVSGPAQQAREAVKRTQVTTQSSAAVRQPGARAPRTPQNGAAPRRSAATRAAEAPHATPALAQGPPGRTATPAFAQGPLARTAAATLTQGPPARRATPTLTQGPPARTAAARARCSGTVVDAPAIDRRKAL